MRRATSGMVSRLRARSEALTPIRRGKGRSRSHGRKSQGRPTRRHGAVAAPSGLVLEQMLPVPGSRVVTFNSIAHRIQARINFDDLQSERSYNQVGAYGQSKLANLMFTYELQLRPSGTGTTIAVAAHPGFTATELARNSPAIVALFYVRV